MTTLVNYYACSYGDRVTAMFSQLPFNSDFGTAEVAKTNRNKLKFLSFYSLPLDEKNYILHNLDNGFYSCHRQFGYDYGDKIRVISIQIDINGLIDKRVNAIHNYNIHKDANKNIQHDYNTWSEHNIFKTDIILPLSVMSNNKKMKQFCALHGLSYDIKWIKSIADDIKEYND